MIYLTYRNIFVRYQIFIYVQHSRKFPEFVIPHVSGHAYTTFFFSGIKGWNSLPSDIKEIKSTNLNSSVKKKNEFSSATYGGWYILLLLILT